MITVFSKQWGCVIGAVAVLAATGCGGPYNAKVSGNVTLDGSTVPVGTVSFMPVEGGPPAYARIDSSGNYKLKTGREEGLPSGQYAVTVVANEPPAVKETADGGPPPPGKPITPPWYRSRESSGLKFSVEPGKNEIDLTLSSQPPEGWKPKRRRRR